ncbi:S8 family serine peptidase [Kineosporia sp. J2-2]|uniref:S8 family serine peptidase n=1 Tax=Kineosporia corallincola TaxID=2835133 RepID=A0ABS5TNZ6_9ACTN|nr:S8 family serine peptidase [Kineosporia corallincola]MBT0772094.1 S8 family serine peptidase [Kineosporia corallincola]
MRKLGVCLVTAMTAVTGVALVASTPASAAPVATAESATTSTATEYIVLQDANTGVSAARTAVEKAGGTVVSENTALGYVVARSNKAAFQTTVNADTSVVGAAANRVIGQAPQEQQASQSQVEKLREATASAAKTSKGSKSAEPLAGLQWDMQQIDATAKGSYAKQTGSKKVLVGIIDTGVDGSHPDIAPNFSSKLSRNFVTDMPDIDGECEYADCKDPADEDGDGHGTHVASTIGSPINGIGIAGVAPNVTLVNIRAGQDSGYFFLEPTLDALTYAGDIGVDVVNMSYYVDPWLFNCVSNPADSAAEQREQQIIRTATQRALNYARNKGVLPVSAEGNESTDLNNPTVDDTSPDYPADAAKTRQIDNSCINVPAESKGVLTVSSTGPSKRKAYYSNYGTQETDVAAPGGDAYDSADNRLNYASMILAAYPEALAKLNGDIDEAGEPTTTAVLKSCKGKVCGYYQYLQGTSMASPHATGVAALVVSEYGKKDKSGLGLDPAKTEAKVLKSATETACPNPRTYHYTIIRSSGTTELDATCEGPKSDNGFYGHGIIDAKAAVTGKL